MNLLRQNGQYELWDITGRLSSERKYELSKLQENDPTGLLISEYSDEQEAIKGFNTTAKIHAMEDIKIVDYGFGDGFVWLELKVGDKTATLQACQVQSKVTKYDPAKGTERGCDRNPIYTKKIDSEDDGMNDGMCADANRDMFERFGIYDCRKFLYQHARKLMGIKIV